MKYLSLSCRACSRFPWFVYYRVRWFTFYRRFLILDRLRVSNVHLFRCTCFIVSRLVLSNPSEIQKYMYNDILVCLIVFHHGIILLCIEPFSNGTKKINISWSCYINFCSEILVASFKNQSTVSTVGRKF